MSAAENMERLLAVSDVMRIAGIAKDAAYALMHRAGAFSLGSKGTRSLRVTQAALDLALLPVRPIASAPTHGGVYYVTVPQTDTVKIGKADSIAARLTAGRCWLPRLALLAWQPGGLSVETEEHERWAHFRVEREWFRMVPALVAHIAELRETHGEYRGHLRSVR